MTVAAMSETAAGNGAAVFSHRVARPRAAPNDDLLLEGEALVRYVLLRRVKQEVVRVRLRRQLLLVVLIGRKVVVDYFVG